MRVFLERVRPASWPAMGMAITAYSTALFGSIALHSGAIGRAIDEMDRATNGWVTASLIYPMGALLLVSIAIFGMGRLRAQDVGWRARAIVPALVVTAAFWVGVQSCLWVQGNGSTWNLRWRGEGGAVLAAVIAQLLGNSLVEETFFRGLLLPQVFLRASRVLRPWLALVFAVSFSVALFVLSHLPLLLDEGYFLDAGIIAPLSWTLRFGLILTLAFLVTENLFICVGLHALWNARPTLIDAPWQTVDQAWWTMTTTLVIGWACGRILWRRRRAPAGIANRLKGCASRRRSADSL
jgi:CAAX protease family protein